MVRKSVPIAIVRQPTCGVKFYSMRIACFISILLLFCPGAIFSAFAQKENEDTLETSIEGKNAKTDEIYFDAEKAKMQDDNKRSEELFERFVAVRPEVSDGFYELSKLYFNDKKISKSEESIIKAIDLDKNNKWYKEQYATILAERGAFIEAATIEADLAKANPDDQAYTLMAADYYERAHKYEDAITYINTAITRFGGDEDLMMHKVQLYLALNNVEKAAGVIRELISQDPRNGRYYREAGEIFDNNKMPQKAADIYKDAQKIIPDDPFVQYGMAEHYLKTGDTASYATLVKKAIINTQLDVENQLDILSDYVQNLPNDSVLEAQALPIVREITMQHPADPDVLVVFGEFLEKNNKRDSAILEFKKSLQVKPANFETWQRLLGDYSDKQYADSLIKYSEKAMRLFPNQALPNYFNGIGHSYKKEYTAATNAIKRAIDILPDDDKQRQAEMYSMLGDIYNTNKQYDLSDKAYQKVIQLDPDNANVLNNYSYYLSERGVKLEEAEKMSKKALELKPKEGTYLDTYGWILYKKGDYAKAKEYVQKAIDLSGPNADGTLYDHLGNIYYKLNDKVKAVEYWKMAKDKGTDDLEIDKKIKEEKLYE